MYIYIALCLELVAFPSQSEMNCLFLNHRHAQTSYTLFCMLFELNIYIYKHEELQYYVYINYISSWYDNMPLHYTELPSVGEDWTTCLVILRYN